MKLISVDPASIVTGVAILERAEGKTALLDGYLVKACRSESVVPRMVEQLKQLKIILGAHRPDRAVIEIPDGKRHGRQGKRNLASLSIYGFAVGVLWQWLNERLPTRTLMVNEATRGRPKRDRQRQVMVMFPNYKPDLDKGFDLSDAIFMGWYELEREKSDGSR